MASTELTKTNSGLPQAGMVERQEFGATELQRSAETAMSAVAARAQAEVQARYVMAMQRPRDIEQFRVRLLKECKRPGFAEQAEYERPVGKEKNERTGEWDEKYARGPSIRMIETAIRCFGNVAAETPVIFDNDEIRIIRAQMTDLETNAFWSQDVVVPKRVEKRGFKKGNNAVEPPKGRQVVGQRVNSTGDVTFLVLATDDETSVKQSALNSKAQRKNGERLLPADIITEALHVCRETLLKQDAEDPDAAKRKIIDAYATLNIRPADLEQYLGKPLDRIQPADIKELRGRYTAIRDGETTWEDVMEAKDPTGTKEAAQQAAADKLASLRAQKPQASSPPTEDAPAEGVTPTHVRDLLAMRQHLGDRWAQVLGNHGYTGAGEVPPAKYAEIIAEMNQVLTDLKADAERGAATEPPKKQNRLKL